MMKKFGIALIVCSLLMACSGEKKQDVGALPIIDVTKDYEEIKIDIHEIADVEYIPLETTDSSLLHMNVIFNVSDKYVVTVSQHNGNITFFDRKTGKYLHYFNRNGRGPEEYQPTAIHLVTDFRSEECYCYDCLKNTLLVYDFKGRFLRELDLKKKPGTFQFKSLHDYNADYLIGYNYFSDDRFLSDEHTPFYLIHKQSGALKPLPLTVEKRINHTIHMSRNKEARTIIGIGFTGQSALLKNGDEFLLADLGEDTIFTLKNNQITPIAVRTPPVHEMEPTIALGPQFLTNDYFYYHTAILEYVPSDPFRSLREAKTLLWNRKENKINKVTFYDSNISKEHSRNVQTIYQDLPSNSAFCFFPAHSLVELHEKGLLKNELDSIASKLVEDDNRVMVLCTFK